MKANEKVPEEGYESKEGKGERSNFLAAHPLLSPKRRAKMRYAINKNCGKGWKGRREGQRGFISSLRCWQELRWGLGHA